MDVLVCVFVVVVGVFVAVVGVFVVVVGVFVGVVGVFVVVDGDAVGLKAFVVGVFVVVVGMFFVANHIVIRMDVVEIVLHHLLVCQHSFQHHLKCLIRLAGYFFRIHKLLDKTFFVKVI